MWYATPVTVHSLLDALVHSILVTTISVGLFTPTIIHDLGFSAANAQLLSVPPFLLAGFSTYIVSTWSDRVNLRGPFIVTCALVSIIGYIIAYTTTTPGPRYTAAIIAACGAFPCIPISFAWAGGNAGGNMKRGIVLAVVIGLGNLGGCASLLRRRGVGAHSSNVILQHLFFVCILSTTAFSQGPRHNDGLPWYEVCAGSSSRTKKLSLSVHPMGSIVCSCIMMWTYKRLNKEKEEHCAREGIQESMMDMYRDLADKSPLFR